MADTLEYSNADFHQLFKSKTKGLSAKSASAYLNTLSEFDSFVALHGLKIAQFSPRMAADFMVHLCNQGLQKSTIGLYLKILSSFINLAAKDGMIEPTAAPRALTRELAESDAPLPVLLNSKVLSGYINLVRRSVKAGQTHNVYDDAFAFAVLAGGLPISEVANLKRQDAERYDGILRSILDRNSDPKRKYIFDLRQSYLTKNQLRADVDRGIAALFPLTEIRDSDVFVRSLWVACALRCGATASDALGCVVGAATYVVPSFFEKYAPREGASPGVKEQMRIYIQGMLANDTPRWYAMHLRRGVSYDEICRAIADRFRPMPDLFYPRATLAKRTGGSSALDSRPFISNTVFFRTNPENVAPMFGVIGDKAWCYRLSPRPGSPFAVISQRDMKRFQAALGLFTPDVAVYEIGSIALRPGEKVVYLRSGFGNREATVEDVLRSDTGSVIFRISLTSDHGYEWRINVAPHEIERLIPAL